MPGHCTTVEAGSSCTATWVTHLKHKRRARTRNIRVPLRLAAERQHAIAGFIPAFGQYIEQGEDCRTSASSSVIMNCEDSDGCSFEEMSDELCAVKDLNMASRLCDADDDPKVGGSLGSLYS